MTANTERPDERYSRQNDIVPPGRLAACRATVVGAIGRQVALQLSAVGIPWLQLVDFDTVEWSNLASQGYLEADMGELKVNATLQLCWRINAACQIQAVPERFRRSMETGNAVFCAVDSIETGRDPSAEPTVRYWSQSRSRWAYSQSSSI
jgi:molybdopterin/thiamine biosynthesis adenylyltransferase